MIKKISKTLILTTSFILPGFLYAQSDGPNGAPGDFKGLVLVLLDLIRLTIPVIVSLSLIAFLWGMAKFILNADDENKRSEGKRLMIWGIIALFVMVSIWGILSILVGSFGYGFGFPQLKTN